MRKLNKNQRKEFEIFLDVANTSAKSAVFLFLDNRWASIMDIVYGLEDKFPGSPRLSKSTVYSSLTKVLADADREIVDEELIPSGYKRVKAKAWRISSRGLRLQPLVAYNLAFLALNYGINPYNVIGAMNSPYLKRASYSRVDILRHLNFNELSLNQIVELFGFPDVFQVERKLQDLANVKDNRGHLVPFVMPVDERLKVIRDSFAGLRRYKITPVGHDYITGCIDYIVGAIAGDVSCMDYIHRNQPSNQDIGEALKLRR